MDSIVNNFRRVSLLLLILMIIACEHGGNYNYYIENESNQKIKIQFTPKVNNEIDVDTFLILNENSKTLFFRWESVNAGSSRQNDFPFKINILNPIEDTLIVDKNWEIIENWDFTTDGKTWGPENEYLFKIEEKNIIKKAL